MRRLATALIVFAAALAPLPGAADVGERALVQDDASLRIAGQTVRLYGVYVPIGAYTCETRVRPTRCASRAALALDFKIQGFVFCDYLERYADGSRGALCAVRCSGVGGRCREDLGAWLIGQGWAVAAPGAPFEYFVQERIARSRGFGIWGFQVDSLIRP